MQSFYRVTRWLLAREGSEESTPTPWDCVCESGRLGSHLESSNEAKADFFVPDALTDGDHVGYGTIGKSNMRVFREQFADLKNVAWCDLSGAYGWHGIAVHRWYSERDSEHTEEEAALVQFLDGLADYPIADESDWGEVQQEEETEQWNDWGRRDFARALCEAHPSAETLIDGADDKAMDSLFWDTCRTEEIYPENSSHECSFPIDRIVSAIDLATLQSALSK